MNKLVIYRTHSQTMALYRETTNLKGDHSWFLLDVCHVNNSRKIGEWEKHGAVRQEVNTISARPLQRKV